MVTDTVRSLTRTNLRVAFTDRGRRRVKGIAEPVQLYVVSPRASEGALASGTYRNRPRRPFVVPVLLAVVLGAGGVAAAWQ